MNSKRTRFWITAMVFTFGLVACSDAPESGDSGSMAAEAEAEQHDGTTSEAGEAGHAEEAGSEGSESHAEAGQVSAGEGAAEHGSQGGESREGGEGEDEHSGEGEGGEHSGEEGEGHDEGDGEGEEGGEYIAAGDTWDAVRRGVRLVLSYDDASGAFRGTVENTTASRICAVRVEVHLEGGPELGPTARADLAAGATGEIVIPVESQSVASWTAHPEMSAC